MPKHWSISVPAVLSCAIFRSERLHRMAICRRWCIRIAHTCAISRSKARSIRSLLRLRRIRLSECSIEDFAQDEIFCIAEPSGLGAPYFRGDIGMRFSQPVEHLSQRRIAALLLEAVIFRVARILEDFHLESPLERVYLSGGLSELACLQQGIALCVPMAVYRLTQGESSLQGAALLAAGMAPAYRREVHKGGGNCRQCKGIAGKISALEAVAGELLALAITRHLKNSD